MIKKHLGTILGAVAIAISGSALGVGLSNSSTATPSPSFSLTAPAVASVSAQAQVQADIACIQTARVSNNAASLGSHKSLAKTDGLLKGCQASAQAWLVANPTPAPTPVPTPTTIPPTPTTVPPPAVNGFASRLGIYSGYQAGTDSDAQQIGLSKFPYVMSFVSGANTGTISGGAASLAQWATGQGSHLIAPFNLLPDSGVSPAQAVSGAMNATAVSYGQALVANGQADAIIRIGWEMNGGWFPWGAQVMSPSQFIAIWHQEVTAFRTVAGQHFTFFWNPTVDANNTCSQWLPPSSEVNYIGVDLYDQTNGAWPGEAAAWQSYLNAPCGLNYISSTATQRNESIILGEVGNGYNSGSNGGDDGPFWTNVGTWSASNNAIVTLWNDGGNLLNNNSPKSEAVLKSLVNQ